MNITVLGATGMVGSRLVTEAVLRTHRVTAASRRPLATTTPGVTAVTLDANAPEQHANAPERHAKAREQHSEILDAALDKADAAVLAIRPAPGREASIAPLTSAVLDATARAGIRLLVVGGAGPLESPKRPGLLVIDDPDHVPAGWRAIAGASTTQLRTCNEHENVDWTYLSPAAVLEPGTRTGGYRRGTTTLLTDPDGTSRISVEDLAVAVLDELERPGGDRHFTIAQSHASRPGGCACCGSWGGVSAHRWQVVGCPPRGEAGFHRRAE
ncbi:NAD(P)-dependent oxidoreductase [Streptomyces sp. NPDC051684]|uniref:NAD(P)-dependent oxidoreductase n=1 Tax=Streptomyces sp. NPDC051684 TaxID=3365670 RepID=UPI0037AA7780